MTKQTSRAILLDHVDAGVLTTDADQSLKDRNAIVQLDPDHPGFRDQQYRARRNRIAQIASEFRPGEPIPEVEYTSEEHDVWRTIWEALRSAHAEHACSEYLTSLKRLHLNTGKIPQLRELSNQVEAISGFRLEPVAGLVEPRVFLENLANGVFLCTQYIRHSSTPLYTPEPDVAHEIIGHAVTLASERLAGLNRLFGDAVRRAVSAERVDLLSRLYWFTIEFGVLREDGRVKAYGTGLLSSAGELQAMSKAELRPLSPALVLDQEYDPTRFQPVLFCADSFEAMYRMLKEYLKTWK